MPEGDGDIEKKLNRELASTGRVFYVIPVRYKANSFIPAGLKEDLLQRSIAIWQRFGVSESLIQNATNLSRNSQANDLVFVPGVAFVRQGEKYFLQPPLISIYSASLLRIKTWLNQSEREHTNLDPDAFNITCFRMLRKPPANDIITELQSLIELFLTGTLSDEDLARKLTQNNFLGSIFSSHRGELKRSIGLSERKRDTDGFLIKELTNMFVDVLRFPGLWQYVYDNSCQTVDKNGVVKLDDPRAGYARYLKSMRSQLFQVSEDELPRSFDISQIVGLQYHDALRAIGVLPEQTNTRQF